MPGPASDLVVVTSVGALLRTPEVPGRRIVAAADHLPTFVRQIRRADLVVLGDDWKRLAAACLLRPFARFRLVAVDLILRTPRSARSRATARAKRALLSAVDRFLFYVRDIRGVAAHYGIGPDRAAYVPFKVNGVEDPRWPASVEPGDHVLCAGRTLRDVDGFLAAMAETGLPGVLLQQDEALLAAHGSRPAGPELPPNVRRVVDPGDDPADFLARIAACRILVVPRFRHDIAATGISTYLVAMALGKPVVISAGPGADDVLDGEAVIVPPEDRPALAAAIARVWSDADFAADLSRRGRAYAAALGGEKRLAADILAESLACLPHRSPTAAGRLAPDGSVER
jgi:glycosyltransferase involved in cell wall biosynthesis